MGLRVPWPWEPDAGRLVRTESPSLPPRPPSDESALDAAIPGRAAIREAYAPTHAAADRRLRAGSDVARMLADASRGELSLSAARERVDTARARVARRQE